MVVCFHEARRKGAAHIFVRKMLIYGKDASGLAVDGSFSFLTHDLPIAQLTTNTFLIHWSVSTVGLQPTVEKLTVSSHAP